jgi:hypothetical protein
MRRFPIRGSHEDPPTPGLVGDHADKLARTPGFHVDYDEEPTREERSYGHTPFEIPVKLPGFMRPRSERPPKNK